MCGVFEAWLCEVPTVSLSVTGDPAQLGHFVEKLDKKQNKGKSVSSATSFRSFQENPTSANIHLQIFS